MKKSMMKKIALMAMVGSMVGMHSAWADPVPEPDDIVISSSGVVPTDYGGDSNAENIWGASGPQTVGQDVVNSIKTSGDVAKNVYGIFSELKTGESFKMDSLSGGINVKSTSGKAIAIALQGTGTNTISNLGNITAETTSTTTGKQTAYGIRASNANTDNTKKFSAAFDSTNGGSISAYSASGANFGIYFEISSTGTSEVNNVNKITAGVTKNDQGAEVISSGSSYGIYAQAGTNTVAFTGAGSSITAKSSGDDASGIYEKGTGKTYVSNLGSITAETSGSSKTAYGIYAKNTNTDNTKKFSVAFDSTNGGNISAYSASGDNYGIRFDTNSTGTSEVMNVKTITAGVATTGGSISYRHAYGIYAAGGVNTVTFTGAESSITAKSSDYGSRGIWLVDGTNTIGTSDHELCNIVVTGGSGNHSSAGIYIQGGTNTINFSSNSSITVSIDEDDVRGVEVTGTGTTVVNNLGSISAYSEEGENYGIIMKNTNTAGVANPEFSVSFVTTGGSISAYSASGKNYGIMFASGSTGTSEVKNVKTITAGVKSDSADSSGASYGIYAEAGVNNVAFTGAGSSITAKSGGNDAYGVAFGNASTAATGTTTITGLGSITAETSGSDKTAYGIYSKGSDVNFANNVSFVTSGGNIKATNATKVACGIRAEGTGTTTVSNIGSIEANCSKYAYGIYSKGSDASFKNNVTFVTSGGSINATSTTRGPYGIGAFGAGTTIVENLSSITAEGSNSTYGIYSGGEDASFANNVTFVTAGGTITATSTGDNAYGIFLINTGTMTVTNLGNITAKTTGASKFAYGIYSKGSADTFANNVSFQGNGGQAITATNTTTAANAYSIYATEQGATTVTFESSVLSGKVKQDGSATLTLTFNNGGVWDVKKDDVSGTVTANVNNGGTIKFAGVNESYSGGNVNVIVSNGGTIDTRSRDDEGKVVTTGGTTKTVDLGSGTFNAQPGSKISLDALTADIGLTMDQIKTTGTVGGTIALGFVNIKVATATTAWETAKKTNIFVDGDDKAQAGITIMGTTTTTTDNYVYTFTGGTSGSVSATSVVAEYKLPQVIQANPENAGKADAYSFDKGDITLEADLGTLNNTYRTSGKPEFTIFGNDHSLIANGKGGVTINTGDTLTVKNLTISGFDTFATNTGILNLTDVTFTGTTGTADVVNNATGEVNIAGTVVLDKGIANEGTVFVGDGAVLTGEVRGGGILEFKGNVDIDSPKVANNIKIDDGKKVSIGSATEAKTVDVTSNSIVINKEAELTVKSKDSGKVVMAENVTITGHENGVLRVTEGSFLEYNNTTEKTIKAQDNNTFTVIVEKDATLDPVVSVFAEGVNVQVDGGGTLVLQPGTLFANIHQDAGSVLKVAAEDIKTTALLSGVDKASQLDVSAGTLQLTGTVKLNDSFKLVEGAAVTNGTITMADMWHVQADGLNGLLAEFIMDKGVIGFEVRNVLTAVEANTSALAGVQQGAAAMVNQLTDKVAENLTLALRPAAEGKYDKQIWASYINSKETVDDRDFWDLKGSNTAKYRGAIVGADFYTSDKVIAGMAISYAKGDISANTIDSTHVQNDSKYYGVSFYDRVTNGPVALTYDIGYQYGKNDISMTALGHITSDVDTQSYTAGVRAERAYKVSKTSTFAPFVSLRYLKLHTKEYKNSNQAKFDANDQNLFIPKLGVAWHGDFVNAKSGWSFKPVAEIGYIFNIGNRSAESKYVTATSRAFNTEYDVVDSGTYYGKLGFRVAKKNFFIGADYNYQKGSTTKNSRWNVNLGWSF